eukprot:207107-Chlamydomonas_euryale.AAC.1
MGPLSGESLGGGRGCDTQARRAEPPGGAVARSWMQAGTGSGGNGRGCRPSSKAGLFGRGEVDDECAQRNSKAGLCWIAEEEEEWVQTKQQGWIVP